MRILNTTFIATINSTLNGSNGSVRSRPCIKQHLIQTTRIGDICVILGLHGHCMTSVLREMLFLLKAQALDHGVHFLNYSSHRLTLHG